MAPTEEEEKKEEEEDKSIPSFDDIADMLSIYTNMQSYGGWLWLSLRNRVGLKGKVVLFSFKTIINYLETIFGLLLLYGIFFRPFAVRPHIDAAALTAFGLAPSNDTLHYDLALNVTFWNDHRIWAIRYNHFTATLYFNGTKLSPPDDTFPKFKSRTRRHRTVHPVLRGRASNVSATIAEEFYWQRSQGWFDIEVRLKATLSYLIWPTRHHYYYEFDCWLHFPSNATAMPAVTGGVKCSKGKRFGIS